MSAYRDDEIAMAELRVKWAEEQKIIDEVHKLIAAAWKICNARKEAWINKRPPWWKPWGRRDVDHRRALMQYETPNVVDIEKAAVETKARDVVRERVLAALLPSRRKGST